MKLGWKPRWETEKAVRKTIEWYKKWHSGDNLYYENIRVLEEYIAS